MSLHPVTPEAAELLRTAEDAFARYFRDINPLRLPDVDAPGEVEAQDEAVEVIAA